MSAPDTPAGPDPLLRVDDLRTSFTTPRGEVRAVDGVSLVLRPGETLGIVGESGSGKSVLVRSIMGLLSHAAGTTVTGTVEFDGRTISDASKAEWRRIWGAEIAMVFQDPMTSLNPVRTIGAHLSQPLRQHLGLGRKDAKERGIELLAEVGIPEPARRMGQYPHELSGGMRQRVGIALALACRPKLLIADEPTTALDVTVQRQILDLLAQVTEDTGMGTLLITHDLGVVAKRTERIMVMYAGRTVEEAGTRPLFADTHHPYTEALLESVPRLSQPPHSRLAAISGYPPDLATRLVGCPFAPRCRYADGEACLTVEPPLEALVPGVAHRVACHHPLGAPVAARTPDRGGDL